MKIVIDSDTFAGTRSGTDLARAAARAEFDAIQLPISPQAPLTPETDHARCLEILRCFRDAGVSITALRGDLAGPCHLAAPSQETRREARRLIAWSLQRGEWLGAEVFSIPALSLGQRNAEPDTTGYAEALARTHHSLTALVPDAEVHGLRLALDVPGDGFLANPVEAAELIDLVNSPWVGLRLDVDRCVGQDRLADWLDYLGWRLAALHLSEVGETVATGQTDRLMQLLGRTVFDGPVVVAGGRGTCWRGRLDRDRTAGGAADGTTAGAHRPDAP